MSRPPIPSRDVPPRRALALGAAVTALLLPGVVALAGEVPEAPTGRVAERPNILVITVDTLRADRLSAAGYHRPTSPNIDRLFEGGIDFAQARTVEPLTNPSICSMFTALPPHRHGASRNGLRIRPGLPSLPKVLAEHGYTTAAFVGNWTLRDKLSGLGEHFQVYEEVLTRPRWFGLLRKEATAEDLTGETVDWVREHVSRDGAGPFMAWVHYVEPHAPYRLHKDFLSIFGDERRGNYSASDRYDTEIAFVDASIAELLDGVAQVSDPANTLIVFASDHGESLGEHNYWGHGRHLYEPTLRIPMALFWKGRLAAARVTAPAVTLDLAPTVLSLLGLPVPQEFEGYDWTAVLDGAPAPDGRVTRYEAHKGAVISKHESDLARRSGLLEIAMIENGKKEIFSVKKDRRLVFDLVRDPQELNALAPATSDPSDTLLSHMRQVFDGLAAQDEQPVEPLDEDSVAALRSLGYVD